MGEGKGDFAYVIFMQTVFPFSPTYKILLLSQYIINLSNFLSHVNFLINFFPFSTNDILVFSFPVVLHGTDAMPVSFKSLALHHIM